VTQNLNPYILEIKGLSPTRRASLFGLVKIRLFIWTLGAFIYGPFHHFYSTIQRSNVKHTCIGENCERLKVAMELFIYPHSTLSMFFDFRQYGPVLP
jgi:hypothetical protein